MIVLSEPDSEVFTYSLFGNITTELRNRLNLILSIVLFTVVTILDIVTTMVALSIGAHELNPVISGIVSVPVYFLTIKLAAICAIAYLGWNIERTVEGAGVIAISFAAAITVLVVHNNLTVIVGLV